MENNYVVMINDMASELLDLYLKKVDINEVDELDRQVVSTYLFGMIDGLRQENHIDINPNQVLEEFINILKGIFNYSESSAIAFSQDLVKNLQTNDKNNPSFVIIHRGLEGYYIWNNSKEETIDDIVGIMNILRSK